jgi:hypothetical protein
MNLPGSSTYDPRKPWLYKYDSINQRMAAFVLSYVDDLRTGYQASESGCAKVTHEVAAKLNYMGEQDAPRKRGQPSSNPGAWAGSVVVSKVGKGLYVTIGQEKWNRTRDIIEFYTKLFGTEIIGNEGHVVVD